MIITFIPTREVNFSKSRMLQSLNIDSFCWKRPTVLCRRSRVCVGNLGLALVPMQVLKAQLWY